VQEHLQKYVADGVITKWAVPEHYVFVEELPRTSVGKIDKKALRRAGTRLRQVSDFEPTG